MASDELRKILEAVKCLALLLEVVLEYFPDWGPMLEDLEDQLLDRAQELR